MFVMVTLPTAHVNMVTGGTDSRFAEHNRDMGPKASINVSAVRSSLIMHRSNVVLADVPPRCCALDWTAALECSLGITMSAWSPWVCTCTRDFRFGVSGRTSRIGEADRDHLVTSEPLI